MNRPGLNPPSAVPQPSVGHPVGRAWPLGSRRGPDRTDSALLVLQSLWSGGSSVIRSIEAWV